MVQFSLPQLTAFHQKQDAFRSFYGNHLGAEYKTCLKQNAPKYRKFEKRVDQAYKAAHDNLKSWKEQTPGFYVNKALNQVAGKPPKAPYQFEELNDADKKALEDKSSFHKTIAKVLTFAGLIFMFASVLAPFVLLPVFISVGVSATATTMMTLVGLGAAGVGLSIGGIFPGNTEAIRMHLAKTDPLFQHFVNKVVQNKKGLDLNLTEERLADKELHKEFHAWREKIKELFEEKIEKVWQELPHLADLTKNQTEAFAKNYIENLKKEKPDFAISNEKFQESLALLKEQMASKNEEISKKLFEDAANLPIMIPIFKLEEKTCYERILRSLELIDKSL